MRDSKKRFLDVRKVVSEEKNILSAASKRDFPEEYFTVQTLVCPGCNCDRLFESGGVYSSDNEYKTFICHDCKIEFEVYILKPLK